MHTKQIQNCKYNILCQLVTYFAKKKRDFIMNTEIYAKVADFLNKNYSGKVGSELKVVNGVFINLDLIISNKSAMQH